MLSASVVFVVIRSDGTPETWLSVPEMCAAYSLKSYMVHDHIRSNGVFRFDGNCVYKCNPNTKTEPVDVVIEPEVNSYVDTQMLEAFDAVFAQGVH